MRPTPARKASILRSRNSTSSICFLIRRGPGCMSVIRKATPQPTSSPARNECGDSTSCTHGLGRLRFARRTTRHQYWPASGHHHRKMSRSSSANCSVSVSLTIGNAKSTPPTRLITNGRSGSSSSSTTPGSTRRQIGPSRFLPIAVVDPGSVRLAYVADVPVNWCPELGTVLANEEVVDGKSEVGGFPVVRRPMRQWMLRITAFAGAIAGGKVLDELDWPDGIKLLQRNWIGRSEGAEIDFKIDKSDQKIRVFTTRPDTLYGATYMVLAPEHSLIHKS